MAQPPRRVKSATESRRRHMEAGANGSSAINGAVSEKTVTSPYSQSISGVSKHGSSEITRRVSQKDKPAIPAKPPLSKMPPPKYTGKSNASSTTVTTVHSKTQSSGGGSEKRQGENRVSGSQSRKTGDVNGEGRPPSGKSRYCVEITLEKKVSTPTVRRKHNDRDISNSTVSSSEESSPSQSPSKSVQFKSSRSNSASSTESRDRFRLGGITGSLPRYQCHTISSSDKSKGRSKSATSRNGSGIEAHSDTQLNSSSNGTPGMEPIQRGRARSVGPIRRVRSNEMMPPKTDLSPSPKSGKISQVRSKSVERSRSRQSFGSFVQRQRQAWEDRVTTVTKRQSLGNVAEKKENRRSLDPNYAPKIMQKSTTVTQRKHMLFGKGANVQKVKSTIDGNQVNKPTSPTLLHQKSDASPQVPKTKSSKSDSDVRSSAKVEANGRVGSKGCAQGDNVPEQKRTSIMDNPPDKPSVLQEIAPSPSTKPNAPTSLPVKPVYQNADSSHRVSTAKENKIGMLVTDLDALDVNGTDETDNGKSHLFIDEGSLGFKPDCLRVKPQTSDSQEYSEIFGLADPKECNKFNSEALHSLPKVESAILESEKTKDTVVDKVKEQEKAGLCNGLDVGEKDGHYFLKVVNEEQSRIESLCRKVEHDLESEMSDEASGICRAFLGKANLLTSKKFKQFRGLCEQNITPSEEAGKTTLASDLAGFWDMVMIQVDDINAKFIDIETLKDNNWKVTVPEVTKPTTRKTPGKRGYGRQVSRDKDEKATQGSIDTNKNKEKDSRAAKLRAAREEARKKMIAAKKQAARERIRSNSSETEVEIFTSSGH